MIPRALNLRKFVLLGAAFGGIALLTTVAYGADRRSAAHDAPAPRWHMAETDNFRIYSFGTRKLDPTVSVRCEALRHDLARRWFNAAAIDAWTPKCILVVHSTPNSYRAAAGRLADCTMACCTIRAVGRKTTLRTR